MGAQVSQAQHDRIVSYLSLGASEGAKVLTGGSTNDVVSGGYYIKPTILSGTNPGLTHSARTRHCTRALCSLWRVHCAGTWYRHGRRDA